MGTIPSSNSAPTITGDPQRPPTLMNRMRNPFVGINPEIAPLPREPAPFKEPAPRQPLNLKPLPPAPALPADYPSGITNPGQKYTVPSLDGVKFPNTAKPDALPPLSRNPAPIPSSAPKLPMPICPGAGSAAAARGSAAAAAAGIRGAVGTTAVRL